MGHYNGNIVYASIAAHGKMHHMKKDGGETYHAHIDVHADIPDYYNYIILSCLLVNMAQPRQDVLIDLAEQMTTGLKPTMAPQGE